MNEKHNHKNTTTTATTTTTNSQQQHQHTNNIQKERTIVYPEGRSIVGTVSVFLLWVLVLPSAAFVLRVSEGNLQKCNMCDIR